MSPRTLLIHHLESDESAIFRIGSSFLDAMPTSEHCTFLNEWLGFAPVEQLANDRNIASSCSSKVWGTVVAPRV
jgi:hypothetical protein